MIRNANLPEKEIERERGVILDEFAQRESDIFAHLLDALYSNAYLRHPYRRSPGGEEDELRRRHGLRDLTLKLGHEERKAARVF